MIKPLRLGRSEKTGKALDCVFGISPGNWVWESSTLVT